jgi:hypothetical protein
MYLLDLNFKKEFLLINFDELLLKHNNPLINSQEHYINYKQNYISATKQNLEKYDNIKLQIDELSNTVLSPSKIFYTYVDQDFLQSLHQQLKTILIHQRNLLDNFLLYLKHINNDYKKIIKENVPQTKSVKAKSSKTLLSRISLLDSRPKRKMASQ